jgi:membrane protein implicated in regulation of membrane protease activity
MSPLFLTTFLLGLVLTVLAMIHGVQRGEVPSFPTPSEIERPTARLNWPAFAAFGTAFGAVGYPLTRSTSLHHTPLLLIAGAAGTLAALGALTLVARWAIPSAMKDEVDERFIYMGHIARVTKPISDAAGEIRFVVDGVPHALHARTLDGTAVTSDTDVVIERVEDGTAYVEPWATVEKRI